MSSPEIPSPPCGAAALKPGPAGVTNFILTLSLSLAPDTVAQVKKGLRGLFNRKKQKAQQYQQGQHGSTATSQTPTSTTTAAAAAPASTARGKEPGTIQSTPTYSNITLTSHADGSSETPPPQPAEAPTPAHHISEPSGVEEAKAVDLNPSSDVTGEATKVEEPKPKVAPTPITKTEPAPASTAKTEPSTGMSATSGPLGDHMAEVYTDVDSTVERKGETIAEAKGEEEGGKV